MLSKYLVWSTIGSTSPMANSLAHTLQELDLGGNKISSEGVKYLADALKVNQNLKVLLLVGNLIGNEGAKLLADALINNQALKYTVVVQQNR